MKKYNLDELQKLIKTAVSGGTVVWLTAPSGHGKSFIGAAIDEAGVKTVHLDKFGAKEDIGGKTRWAVSMPESTVKDHSVFEGHADNPKVIAKQLYLRAGGKPFVIILVQASLELFRSIQAAKARDHAATAKTEVTAWTKSWLEKSKITPSDFAKKWNEYYHDLVLCVAAAVNEVEPLELFKSVEPLTAKVLFKEWAAKSGLLEKIPELLDVLQAHQVAFRILENTGKVESQDIAGWHGTPISNAVKTNDK